MALVDERPALNRRLQTAVGITEHAPTGNVGIAAQELAQGTELRGGCHRGAHRIDGYHAQPGVGDEIVLNPLQLSDVDQTSQVEALGARLKPDYSRHKTSRTDSKPSPLTESTTSTESMPSCDNLARAVSSCRGVASADLVTTPMTGQLKQDAKPAGIRAVVVGSAAARRHRHHKKSSAGRARSVLPVLARESTTWPNSSRACVMAYSMGSASNRCRKVDFGTDSTDQQHLLHCSLTTS